MRLTYKILLPVLLLFGCQTSQADVTWLWAFGTEFGILTTDGTYADTTGSFTFNFISFEVSDSQLPGNIGATYVENQAPQGFIWNGSFPTQFFRSNGGLTNGSNFFTSDFIYAYVLAPPPILSFLASDGGKDLIIAGVILLIPDDSIFTNGFE